MDKEIKSDPISTSSATSSPPERFSIMGLMNGNAATTSFPHRFSTIRLRVDSSSLRIIENEKELKSSMPPSPSALPMAFTPAPASPPFKPSIGIPSPSGDQRAHALKKSPGSCVSLSTPNNRKTEKYPLFKKSSNFLMKSSVPPLKTMDLFAGQIVF